MKHAKAVPVAHSASSVFDMSALQLEAFRIGWYLVLWAISEHFSGTVPADVVRNTAVIWAPACVLSLIFLRRGGIALYAATCRAFVSWAVLTVLATKGVLAVSLESVFVVLGCGAVSFAILLLAAFYRANGSAAAAQIIRPAPVMKQVVPASLEEPVPPVIDIPKAGWTPKSKPPASPEELAIRVAATTGKPATRQEPVIRAKESRAEAPTKRSSPARAQPPVFSQSPEQCQLFDFPAEMSDAQHEVYLKYLSRSVFS